MLGKVLRVLDEDDLAHVFAVGVPEEALLNLCLALGCNRLRVDEVPEAEGAITGASDESSQAGLLLQSLAFVSVCETDLELLIDDLDVVYWAIVREECPHDLGLLDILIVPKEYHVVAVDGKEPGALLVANHRHHISILALLILLNLDLFHSGLNVGLAQWRWLLIRSYVLQALCVEHSNDAIGTGAVEQVFARVDGATKGTAHLDVHPLAQLTLFVEDIEVASRGQSVDQIVVACHGHKDSLLDLAQVHALPLQHQPFLILRFLIASFVSYLPFVSCLLQLPKVPELQMGIADCDHVPLLAVEGEAIDIRGDLV